jgi:hypothetical protein
MSQSGYTPISNYSSATASAVPLAANLVQGELAINTNDGKLFYKDSSGVVQTMASKATGAIGGSTTQVQFNSSGALAGSANLTFNGTTLTSAGFAGPGTGLTGTASGLSIGGNAATATSATSATSATTATNLAGGAASQIPYQTGAGATTFLANGTAGQVLTSNGASAPTWSSPAGMTYPGAGIANSTGSAWGTSYTTSGSGTVVALNNTPTLTNPTVTNYTETTVTANTSTAYTIDNTNGTLQILTLTGNCTFTFPTATAGKSFTLFLKQDATGSRTVTWPASVKWPSGTAPTITATASKADKYVFTADGSSWAGSNAGQNYTL